MQLADQRAREAFLGCLRPLSRQATFRNHSSRSGQRLPPRPMTVLGWAATGLLTLYGGVNVLAEALTASGVVKPTQPVDWKPLLGHLYVWDMSFLIWGIPFGLAAWHFTRNIRVRQPRIARSSHAGQISAETGPDRPQGNQEISSSVDRLPLRNAMEDRTPIARSASWTSGDC